MLIIKNKCNAPIEIRGVIIYPNENKKIPNTRMTDHIRNLLKIGVIGVSEIDDTIVTSSEELKKSHPKINSTKGATNEEKSIDPNNVESSIEIPTGSSNKNNKSKGDK